MAKPSRKPSRPPAVKRLAKPSRSRPGSTRASATAAPAPTVASPPAPPPVRLTVEDLRALLQTPEGQALRAELLPVTSSPPSPAAADDGAPFGRAYPPPLTEQVALRLTAREHALYTTAARRPDLWPEARAIFIYDALRRLAWEGARARGLTLDAATAAPAQR